MFLVTATFLLASMFFAIAFTWFLVPNEYCLPAKYRNQVYWQAINIYTTQFGWWAPIEGVPTELGVKSFTAAMTTYMLSLNKKRFLFFYMIVCLEDCFTLVLMLGLWGRRLRTTEVNAIAIYSSLFKLPGVLCPRSVIHLSWETKYALILLFILWNVEWC